MSRVGAGNWISHNNNCTTCIICHGPADAVLENLLSSQRGMPAEVKDCLRQLHQLHQQHATNPVSMFSHSSLPGDRFPMEQLLQYEHSLAVQPYIKAKRYLAAGLELCLERQQLDAGLKLLAAGCAVCHRVMLLPGCMLPQVEMHLKAHPGAAEHCKCF